MSTILNLASGAPLSITGTNTYISGGRPDVLGPIDFLKDGKARMTTRLPIYYPAGVFDFPDDPQCRPSQLSSHSRRLQQQCSGRCRDDQLLVVNSKPGQLGNLGDSIIEGPGNFRFDLSASKTFRISEIDDRTDPNRRAKRSEPSDSGESQFEHQSEHFGQI